MSVIVIPQLITAIGTFTALSAADDDYLALDPKRCSIPAQGVARTTIENKAGADDAFIEDALEGAQVLTLGGDLTITSNGNSSEAGYFTALGTLLDSLKSALDALKTADDDLVCNSVNIPVRWYSALEPSFADSFWVCSVTFGLVVHA